MFKQLLTNKKATYKPAVYSMVDVRDAALIHIRALESKCCGRIACGSPFTSFAKVLPVLAEVNPQILIPQLLPETDEFVQFTSSHIINLRPLEDSFRDTLKALS